MLIFHLFRNASRNARKHWSVNISVNIARKIECYISKSKLILCKWNAFYFSEIVFIDFTSHEIKQCIVFFATPGILYINEIVLVCEIQKSAQWHIDRAKRIVIKCLKNLPLQPVSSKRNLQVVNNFEFRLNKERNACYFMTTPPRFLLEHKNSSHVFEIVYHLKIPLWWNRL